MSWLGPSALPGVGSPEADPRLTATLDSSPDSVTTAPSRMVTLPWPRLPMLRNGPPSKAVTGEL